MQNKIKLDMHGIIPIFPAGSMINLGHIVTMCAFTAYRFVTTATGAPRWRSVPSFSSRLQCVISNILCSAGASRIRVSMSWMFEPCKGYSPDVAANQLADTLDHATRSNVLHTDCLRAVCAKAALN